MPDSPTLNLNTIDYPFETLVTRAKATPPKLRLDPVFQRKYKWDKDGWRRASKFIESCLMRIPLPSCYFAEADDRAHLVIDGVQRITTVMKFMNDEFALEGMTAFPHLEGKKFSDLGELQAELESTTIRCIVLRNENPKRLIAEIFSRLNKGAVELSDQEIRHAMFAGKFDELLSNLAENPIIANFGLGKSGQSSRDSREGEELVLRYFAFSDSDQTYEGSLSQYLDAYMEKASKFNADKIVELEHSFNNALSSCLSIFSDEEVFSDISSQRTRQSILYYDLLMGSLGLISPSKLKRKKTKIRKAFINLCESQEFTRLTAGGIQRKSSVSKRNELWNNMLKEAIRAR